jgi:hypothetical protein|tara:strand:- start:2276 stop:2878 length:603 start_codon:yes stop_codon:yes gene_type:complete
MSSEDEAEQQTPVVVAPPPQPQQRTGGQAIAEALSKVNGSLIEPTKSGKGNFGNAYVTLPQLLEVLRGPLNDAGLSVQQHVSSDGKHLLTEIRHVSNESHTTAYPILETPGKGQQRNWGFQSAVTYARRYALMMLFGLSGDDEVEETKKGAVKISESKQGATPADGEGIMPLVVKQASTTTTADEMESIVLTYSADEASF